VRKQLFEIKSTGANYVLILAGDHLYRMDYRPLAKFHWDNNADITVAVQPILKTSAYRYGLLKRDSTCRIIAFVEKPTQPEILADFVSRDDPEKPYLGSMGIYLFNTDVLIDVLDSTTYDDFGSQIIPNALPDYSVYGYDFEGFWEDIGTIRSFYEINLMLARPDSPFNFHDPEQRIYTRPRFLPGSVVAGATLNNVLLTDGCKVFRADIRNSVIGLRSQISDGVKMYDTVMMGSDYYDPVCEPPLGNIPLGVGPDSVIEGAILDKNVRIGKKVTIKPFPPDVELDEGWWVVKDGIVVIPKNTVLPDGTSICPDLY
jgi:glucose-1-phosphate adenylyltransferase